MADDMAVMYLGKVVEMGRTSEVFDKMAHPYTQALISAVPQVSSGEQKQTIFLEGEIPSPHQSAFRLLLSHPLSPGV